MVTKTERVWVAKAGGPERLQVQAKDIKAPKAGEILIEMEAAGVAFADIMIREGKYPGVQPPVTPGYDIVGRVIDLGEGVNTVKVGDRVAALTIFGSYARHRTLYAERVIKAPERADPAELVALVLNYSTAYQMLCRCTQLKKGDWALIHGAAGGVGQALLQLCKHFGINAIGTASKHKHSVVTQYGAHPINYKTEDFVSATMSITRGLGVDAVFDHVGGHYVRRSYSTLRPWGMVISYGAMAAFSAGRFSVSSVLRSGFIGAGFNPVKMLVDNRGIIGFDIGGRFKARPEFFMSDLAEIFRLYESGHLEPEISGRFPLEHVAEAHIGLGRSAVTGKLVLVP